MVQFTCLEAAIPLYTSIMIIQEAHDIIDHDNLQLHVYAN